MLGDRLPEAKKRKKICQTSGLKTGRGGLRSLNSSGLCERALGTVFDLETKRLFTKWSLPGPALFHSCSSRPLASFNVS